MSKQDFAERMRKAREAKKEQLKAGDEISAEAPNEQINEELKESEKFPVKITSSEFAVISSGDEISAEINGTEQTIILDEEQAKDLNEQIQEEIAVEAAVNLEEKKEPIKLPTEITSVEFAVFSSENHRFCGSKIVFKKDQPVFLTDRVLDSLMTIPNFKNLVDKGVIKIGL